MQSSKVLQRKQLLNVMLLRMWQNYSKRLVGLMTFRVSKIKLKLIVMVSWLFLLKQVPLARRMESANFMTVAVMFGERKKGNSTIDCWYLNNEDAEACVLEAISPLHENRMGPTWMQFAMRMMTSAPRRKTPFGVDNLPLLRKGKYPMTFLYTYIKCCPTYDENHARLKEFGEFLKLALVRTAAEGDRTVNLFTELYKTTISPNLLNVLPQWI